MRGTQTGSLLLALAGLSIQQGGPGAHLWPWDPRAALLLLLPLAAVLAVHIRNARQRRLRRYGLGW